MAQAIQKITLSAARDIPFNKLVLSQQNVRKIKAGVSIEDLAEDIAHRGLLTSLNVRPELDGDGNETGIYRIPAGGRRYRALERLVAQKRLAKTAGVPCAERIAESAAWNSALPSTSEKSIVVAMETHAAWTSSSVTASGVRPLKFGSTSSTAAIASRTPTSFRLTRT